MGYTPTREELQECREKGLRWRFAHRSSSFNENPLRPGYCEPDPEHPPHILCEMFDQVSGRLVASGRSLNVTDEGAAFQVALDASRTAPKPLTPLQASDPNFVNMVERSARVSDLERENAELRRLLEDKSATSTGVGAGTASRSGDGS